MATTIIEKDSSSPAAAVLIFIVFALLIAGIAWFAYTNGIVGKPQVIEHNKTIVVPSPVPAPNAEPPPAK